MSWRGGGGDDKLYGDGFQLEGDADGGDDQILQRRRR